MHQQCQATDSHFQRSKDYSLYEDVADLSSEYNSANVSTECSSHQDECEGVQTNTTIIGHTPLRIHVIGGQRLVRIVPPSPYLSHSAVYN